MEPEPDEACAWEGNSANPMLTMLMRILVSHGPEWSINQSDQWCKLIGQVLILECVMGHPSGSTPTPVLLTAAVVRSIP